MNEIQAEKTLLNLFYLYTNIFFYTSSLNIFLIRIPKSNKNVISPNITPNFPISPAKSSNFSCKGVLVSCSSSKSYLIFPEDESIPRRHITISPYPSVIGQPSNKHYPTSLFWNSDSPVKEDSFDCIIVSYLMIIPSAFGIDPGVIWMMSPTTHSLILIILKWPFLFVSWQ